MIIETKLDIGDEVFFIQNSKIHTTEIAEIDTKTRVNSYSGLDTHCYYTISVNPAGSQYTVRGFTDTELFKTKQELLETL